MGTQLTAKVLFTRRLKRFLSALLLSVGIEGCLTTRDFGFGTCMEYTPMCENMICERDVKGCEVCTCSEDNTQDNDLLKPYPRAPRDP